MSEGIPEGWNKISIDDLGTTFNGLTKKTAKDFGSGKPYLTYLQVFNSTLSNKYESGLVEITEDENQSGVIYGDILFTTSSETPEEIGYTSVFLDADWSPYLNSFCFGIRPKEHSPILPEYGQFLFRGNQFRQSIKPLAQGSTRFNLSKENLKKLEINYPPISEQQRIASILTSVDGVIEKTESQISKLQDLKKGMMQELLAKGIGHTEFIDSPVGRIPDTWKVHDLQTVTSRIIVGLATSVTKYYRDSGTPIIRNLNIKNGYFDGTKMLYIDPDFANQNQSKAVNTSDVLTVHTGANIGLTCLVPEEHNDSQTFTTLITTTKNDTLLPKYLMHHMNSDLGISEIDRLQVGGGKNNLNVGDLVNYQIAMPDNTEEQHNIVTKIDSISTKVASAQNKLSQIQNLKKALMQDLLTGKVRVKMD